ncbi:MAG: hypothetical protein D6685_01865 [Bacteroidetes bacterium]|nr:MAG: hypothetical protein D6685_01865 [Bacteroidota bacterium]
MPADADRPEAPRRPDIRPLSRTASRLLVVAALLGVLGTAVASVLLLRHYATDPRVLEQVEDARARLQARADSAAAAADSTAAGRDSSRVE